MMRGHSDYNPSEPESDFTDEGDSPMYRGP